VLELASELGIKVEERDIWPMELYVADAVFLTGSGAGIASVGAIDGHPIATTEHPHFAAVTAAYRESTRDARRLVHVTSIGEGSRGV